MKYFVAAVAFCLLASGARAQSPLVITTTTCPTLTLNVAWQCQFTATGGTPPYHWSILQWNSGYLPGLTMSDSGLLSGTVMQCSNNVPTNCVPPPPSGAQVVIDGVTIPVKAAPIPKQPVTKKKPKKTT